MRKKIKELYEHSTLVAKIRYSYLCLLVPFVLFLIFCFYNLWNNNRRYEDMINSSVMASQFSLDFQKDFDYETYLLIVGNKTLEESSLHDMLVEADDIVAGLEELTESQENLKRLTSVKKYLNNLETYIGRIEDNIREGNRYEDNIRPRWKRAMAIPNSALGEAVGEMYVEKFFPAEDKARMMTLVENLRTALGQHIDQLDWMSDSTKMRAREKLAAFHVKIGYPDKWKDYSTLEIDPTLSYWENIQRASEWATRDQLAKVGKAVDPEEWLMTPQTVNAYYNPTTNEICFPAAILQPPFFNPAADDAVNYGAIGVVIGHEMTHGFDDQGRQFDKDGNMNNWWTDADAEAFKQKTDILVKQFDAIEVLPARGDQPAVFANGSLCLGENIADQGGLRVAYTALMNTLNGTEPEPIDGLTPAQRFYLSYATVWAQNIRDEEIARLTKLDVHSLGQWRVDATLRNLQDFFDAFNITDGKMYMPVEERVIIW